MTLPLATARPIRYAVSCFPLDHEAHQSYRLLVEYDSSRAPHWTITDGSGHYYDIDGQPGQRYDWLRPDLAHLEQTAMTDDQRAEAERRATIWWDAHTFNLDAALAIAEAVAPRLTVNRVSAAEVYAAFAAFGPEE